MGRGDCIREQRTRVGRGGREKNLQSGEGGGKGIQKETFGCKQCTQEEDSRLWWGRHNASTSTNRPESSSSPSDTAADNETQSDRTVLQMRTEWGHLVANCPKPRQYPFEHQPLVSKAEGSVNCVSNACSSIEQGRSLKAKGASLSLGGVDSKQKASAQSEATEQKRIMSTKEKEPTYKVVGSGSNEI